MSGDWSRRPELAALAGRVLLWRDRYRPPGHEDAAILDEPFLGPGFQFLEREPGTLPWAGRVHCYRQFCLPCGENRL